MNVKTETALVVLAYNLTRVMNILDTELLLKAIPARPSASAQHVTATTDSTRCSTKQMSRSSLIGIESPSDCFAMDGGLRSGFIVRSLPSVAVVTGGRILLDRYHVGVNRFLPAQ